MSGYCIIKESNNPYPYMGLVDRTKIKKRWWTLERTELMVFQKESAAQFQVSKLKYGNPKVVSYKEAVKAIAERNAPSFSPSNLLMHLIRKEHNGPIPVDELMSEAGIDYDAYREEAEFYRNWCAEEWI